ncbi:MAG: nucleotidyl transferase AbiEii/AbiGii toxin family protein [Fibrobacterota bacterium]
MTWSTEKQWRFGKWTIRTWKSTISNIGWACLRKSGLRRSITYDLNSMETQKDYKELVALLNSNNVEYVIVGGYARAFYGSPRYTGDIDFLVMPSPENADRLLKALEEFGFAAIEFKREDILTPGTIFQLGVPPVRIDLITSVTGVLNETVFANKQPGHYAGLPVFYIGKNEFLVNKRATGRLKDLADAEALEG